MSKLLISEIKRIRTGRVSCASDCTWWLVFKDRYFVNFILNISSVPFVKFLFYQFFHNNKIVFYFFWFLGWHIFRTKNSYFCVSNFRLPFVVKILGSNLTNNVFFKTRSLFDSLDRDFYYLWGLDLHPFLEVFSRLIPFDTNRHDVRGENQMKIAYLDLKSIFLVFSPSPKFQTTNGQFNVNCELSHT